MAVNEAILEASGGSWDDPPSEEAIEQFRGFDEAELRAALLSDKRGTVVGFKDPRISLTFPMLRRVLPKAILVASRRASEAVAESLRARNGFSLDESLSLYSIYTDRLSSYGARFVDFPSQKGLRKLVADLGLKLTSDAESWFDVSLVHHGAV